MKASNATYKIARYRSQKDGNFFLVLCLSTVRHERGFSLMALINTKL
jgi:hypothetical protein